MLTALTPLSPGDGGGNLSVMGIPELFFLIGLAMLIGLAWLVFYVIPATVVRAVKKRAGRE